MTIPISQLQQEVNGIILAQGISGNLITLVNGPRGEQGPANPTDPSSGRLDVGFTGHGLTQGDAIYFDGTQWQKALANSFVTCGYAIADIIDQDNFYAVYSGVISDLEGLSSGEYYYVSDTVPGLLTLSEGTISNPLMVALSSTEGLILPWRPNDPSAGGSGNSDNGDATSSIAVTFTGHGFTNGEAVYFDGSQWQKALSDSAYTLGIGIITYINSNNFTVTVNGILGVFSNLIPGSYYFVSPTIPGGLTTEESGYSNPLVFSIGSTQGIVLPWRPSTSLSTTESYISLTGNATAGTDVDTIFLDSTSGGFTVTLYSAAQIPGKIYRFKKTNAATNAVIINPYNTETIDGSLTLTMTTQYSTYTISNDSSNWYII